MKELIFNDKTPAKVEFNFDELKQALEDELKPYRELVVTEDTVKSGKELATELNKTKKAIDDQLKAAIKKASEPLTLVDNQRKELSGMIDEGRREILKQVEVFENKRREEALEKLEAYRSELWDDYGIGEEFRRAEVADLANLSTLTQKGRLSAKSVEAVKSRIMADKNLQDQTRLRLSELTNESHKIGLAAPLTRDHVEHFLFKDEETYNAELSRILDAELNRQAQAEHAARERDERKRQADERAQAESNRSRQSASQ